MWSGIAESTNTQKEWAVSWTFDKCQCLATWSGQDDDFFFCHWFAESENAIIETLSQAGADDFMITMAIEISTPKMDLEKMKSLIETIK